MRFYRIDHRDFSPECGDDNNIFGREVLQIRIGRVGGEMLDAERIHLGIHIWIMDDFSQQKNPLAGKNLPRCIGEVDRPFDPVAKAEFLRQSNGRIADL